MSIAKNPKLKNVLKRVVSIITGVAIVIAISFGTATVVNKNKSSRVNATVKNGLSAYELAV